MARIIERVFARVTYLKEERFEGIQKHLGD